MKSLLDKLTELEENLNHPDDKQTIRQARWVIQRMCDLVSEE